MPAKRRPITFDTVRELARTLHVKPHYESAPIVLVRRAHPYNLP